MHNIRNITQQDVGVLRSLASQCPPLGVHTAYTYWVLCHFFSSHSFIIEDNQKTPCGFITTIQPPVSTDTLFIWQIGILPNFRSQGLAKKLLEAVCRSAKLSGSKKIQVSIDPDNAPSNLLFSRFAQGTGCTLSKTSSLSFEDPLDKCGEFEYIFELAL